MKIVFLDIDGVLTTQRTRWNEADPDCVRELNRIIEETGAAIVVSSTWRMGRTRIQLCDIFNEWGVKAKVLGSTPVLDVRRGQEIQMWLSSRDAERADVSSFVILDDDSDMDHLLPFLIKTKGPEGLRTTDADRAIKMLNK